MARITSPTAGASVGCGITIIGTCDGDPVTVEIRDTSGRHINGAPAEAKCNDGHFSLDYEICGISSGTEIVIRAEDSGGADEVAVRLTDDCPEC